MFDPVCLSETPVSQAAPADRRVGTAGGVSISTWTFARMLDVVDYGMLLLVDTSHVSFANQTAREELDEGHPLQMLGRELRARDPQDVAALRLALSSALQRQVQTLLTLGGSGGTRDGALSVSVVPLSEQGEPSAALIIFGRRDTREGLATDAFARHHQLTSAETRVLKMLCTGCRPADIAAAHGVRVSTVRTQVGSIRAKVGTRDVGGIVRRVACLPPLPCLVRSSVR
jgi:DNA-binding CsgD family transcriptional regulator